MRVGGKRGPGGPRGPSGPGGASGPEKAKGVGFAGKVEKNAGVEQVSAGATSSVGAAGEVAPSAVVREAIAIAKELQEGRIGDKAAATGKLVESILKEKLGQRFGRNKKVAKAIADTISEDPHLQSVLERIWSHREG